MNLNKVKQLVELKLKGIDNSNKFDGKNIRTRLDDELRGMNQLLYTLGYDMTLSINPYFYENNISSKIVSIEPIRNNDIGYIVSELKKQGYKVEVVGHGECARFFIDSCEETLTRNEVMALLSDAVGVEA